MIKKKKSRKRKDYDLLKGSANTMNYIAWRYSPKFHSKALLERFKMNNTIRCKVLEKYNHQCVICGSKKDLQIDQYYSSIKRRQNHYKKSSSTLQKV